MNTAKAGEEYNKWDLRFLELAKLVSTWSRDPSTQTGAAITSPSKKVISLGYNGFPQSMPDKEEYYKNREEKYSRIIHCEMNAVLTAGKLPPNCTLYTWPFASCDRCCVHMIQAGIRRFVFPAIPDELIERWSKSVELTKRYIEECNCSWTEVHYD